MQETPPNQLTKRNWAVMFALALTGQIAWAVENSWFNTFVFDTITPDPRPIAWMVAASAVTATLTTLIMGTLSDRTRTRWGKRRPYILLGYILWGLSTILFPTVAYIKITLLAVVMVVIADSGDDLFGSTANDAAFNAWTVDVATSETRGRVEGVKPERLPGADCGNGSCGDVDRRFWILYFLYAGRHCDFGGFLGGLFLQEPDGSQEEPVFVLHFGRNSPTCFH